MTIDFATKSFEREREGELLKKFPLEKIKPSSKVFSMRFLP